MAYDPKLPYKNIDGVNINLNAQELIDLAQAQNIAVAQAPLLDNQKQISSLLAQQTPDLLRAAILGDTTAKATLQTIHNQLTALRAATASLQATVDAAITGP